MEERFSTYKMVEENTGTRQNLRGEPGSGSLLGLGQPGPARNDVNCTKHLYMFTPIYIFP